MSDLQEYVFAELSEPKLNFYDYNVSIIGRSGAGKSTLAVELFKDVCCIMDVEKGNKQVRGVPKKEPKDWKEIKAILKEWSDAIKKGFRPPFQVLLWDTQTKLAQMCEEYMKKTKGWKDFQMGADKVNRWSALKDEYSSVLNGFAQLGFKNVNILHGGDKEIKLRNQEPYQQFTAKVGATYEYSALGEPDFVFYLDLIRIEDEQGKPKTVRRLVLQNDADYFTKCRFPELPDDIIYEDYRKGVKAFYKAWDEAVNNKNEAVEEDETSYSFASTNDNEVIEEVVEDKVEEIVETIEELQEKAANIRDELFKTNTQKEVANILKKELGNIKVAEVTDKVKLIEFINKYTS